MKPANPSITAGATQQFHATGTYINGSTKDLTKTVTRTSSTTTVATISNASGIQGLATSVALGTTTVTAASGTIKGTTKLTITAPAVTLISLAVTPTAPSINMGVHSNLPPRAPIATAVLRISPTQRRGVPRH